MDTNSTTTMSNAEKTLAQLTEVKRQRPLTSSETYDRGDALEAFLWEDPPAEKLVKYGIPLSVISYDDEE